MAALFVASSLAAGLENAPPSAYRSALHSPEPQAPEPRPVPPPGAVPHPEPRPVAQPGPSPERLHRMIESLRMARMSEALRLNEEEAARMAVRMRELEEERERLERERQEILPRMREILEKADFERRPAPEKDLQPLLERLRALQEETGARLRELEARLMDGLSAEQRARMILFQRDFEREVDEMIRLARVSVPPPPPR